MRNRRAQALICAATLALLVGQAGQTRANLIVNGSFETPDVGLTGIAVISQGSEPAGFGWRVERGTVEVLGQLYPRLPGPAFHGTQFLDLNGVSIGTLSQAFATTPGLTYRLSFVYANNYVHTNPANPARAMVRLTDTATGEDLQTPLAISHGTSTSRDLDWALGTLTFTATGGSTTLRFISNSPTTLGGILLDRVSVNTIDAAPEAFYLYPDSGEVAAGVALDVYVLALDATGDLLFTYGGEIAFWTTDGAATLPKPYTFQPEDGGMAYFPKGVTFRTAGIQELYVFDTATFTILGYAAFEVTGR